MKRKLFGLLIVLMLVLIIPALSVGAAGESWTVQSLNTVGCANAAIGMTTMLSGVTFPTTLRFRTIVDAGGLRYMDEDAGEPGGGGVYDWHLYNSSSGGPTTAVFPIPADTAITVTLALIDGVGGPIVTSQTFTITKCNGGTIVSTLAADCPNPLPVGSVVYSIPAGAPTFYAPDLGTQTNFNLPAGSWYVSEFSGDFAKVWIACSGNPVYIPANAVAR